jgi:hypothetical protein
MGTRTIARTGGAAGALYVVLVFVGQGIAGSGDSPALGSPPADYARWLAANGPSTVGYAGAFLELIGLLAFVVFVAVLYDLLRRSERERTWLPAAALGAGLVSAAIKIGSAPPLLAAFSLRHTIDPQLAKALIEMNDYAFLLTWAVDAVMLGAVAASALRTGALPRWLAISAGVIARCCWRRSPVAMTRRPSGSCWRCCGSRPPASPSPAPNTRRSGPQRRSRLRPRPLDRGRRRGMRAASPALLCTPCPRSISTG